MQETRETRPPARPPKTERSRPPAPSLLKFRNPAPQGAVGIGGQIMGGFECQAELHHFVVRAMGAMEGSEQGRAGLELDFNKIRMAVVLSGGGECGLYCHTDPGLNSLSGGLQSVHAQAAVNATCGVLMDRGTYPLVALMMLRMGSSHRLEPWEPRKRPMIPGPSPSSLRPGISGPRSSALRLGIRALRPFSLRPGVQAPRPSSFTLSTQPPAPSPSGIRILSSRKTYRYSLSLPLPGITSPSLYLLKGPGVQAQSSLSLRTKGF
ncbi:hypothetical protein Cadr_000012229 [Camelus dromedarius]|uniref:Uncharacterized protein n=1 Tax=Camelus dromedarius TaxID=9838 RepID=A0A5N4DRH0_CAMDR|nr:hypothetical protein Cadr_000012229 [Camelus dromedarius]